MEIPQVCDTSTFMVYLVSLSTWHKKYMVGENFFKEYMLDENVCVYG